MDTTAKLLEKGQNSSKIIIRPSWILEESLLSLSSKFPLIPGSEGAVVFCTTPLSHKLQQRSEDADFDLTDSHSMSLSQYNVLHDIHLKDYFKNPIMCRRLIEKGFITEDGYVKCNLMEFNAYRQWIRKIKLDDLHQARRAQRAQEEKKRRERELYKQLVRDKEAYSIVRNREEKAKEAALKAREKREKDRIKYIKKQESDLKRREQWQKEMKQKKDEQVDEREKQREKQRQEKMMREQMSRKIKLRIVQKRSEDDKRQESNHNKRKKSMKKIREEKMKDQWKRRCSISLAHLERKQMKEMQRLERRRQNIERRTSTVQEHSEKQQAVLEQCLKTRRNTLYQEFLKAEEFMQHLREKKERELNEWRQKHERIRSRTNSLPAFRRSHPRNSDSSLNEMHRRRWSAPEKHPRYRSRLKSVWDVEGALLRDFEAGQLFPSELKGLQVSLPSKDGREPEEARITFRDLSPPILEKVEEQEEEKVMSSDMSLPVSLSTSSSNQRKIKEKKAPNLQEVRSLVGSIIANAFDAIEEDQRKQVKCMVGDIVKAAIAEVEREEDDGVLKLETRRQVRRCVLDIIDSASLKLDREIEEKRSSDRVSAASDEDIVAAARELVSALVAYGKELVHGDTERKSLLSQESDDVQMIELAHEIVSGAIERAEERPKKMNEPTQVVGWSREDEVDSKARSVVSKAILSAVNSLERFHQTETNLMEAATGLMNAALITAKESLETCYGVTPALEDLMSRAAWRLANQAMISAKNSLDRLHEKQVSRIAEELATDAIVSATNSLARMEEQAFQNAAESLAMEALLSAKKALQMVDEQEHVSKQLTETAVLEAQASIERAYSGLCEAEQLARDALASSEQGLSSLYAAEGRNLANVTASKSLDQVSSMSEAQDEAVTLLSDDSDFEFLTHEEAMLAEIEIEEEDSSEHEVYMDENVVLHAARFVNDIIDNAYDIVKEEMIHDYFHPSSNRRRKSSVRFSVQDVMKGRRESNVPRESDFLSVLNRPPTPRFLGHRKRTDSLADEDFDEEKLGIIDDDDEREDIGALSLDNEPMPLRHSARRFSSDHAMDARRKKVTFKTTTSLSDSKLRRSKECSNLLQAMLGSVQPNEVEGEAGRQEAACPYDTLLSMTNTPEPREKGSRPPSHISQTESDSSKHDTAACSIAKDASSYVLLPRIPSPDKKIYTTIAEQMEDESRTCFPVVSPTTSLVMEQELQKIQQKEAEAKQRTSSRGSNSTSLPRISPSGSVVESRRMTTTPTLQMASKQRSIVDNKHIPSPPKSPSRPQVSTSFLDATAKVTPKASTDAAKVTPKASADTAKVTPKASTDTAKVTPKASTDAAKVTPKASADTAKVTPKASTDTAKVTPKASTDPAKVTPKASTDTAKMTPKASTDAAKVTPKASTDTAKVTPKASTDAAKVTPKASTDAAKVTPKASTDTAKVTPKASTDAAKVTPKASADTAKVTPKASTDTAKVTPKASTDPAKVTPKASTDTAKMTPKASTDAAKVTPKASTDAAKVTPKASTDAAKVTPKASADTAKVTPKASTDTAKVTPKASTDPAKVTPKASTDTAKVTPKASTDAPKVTPKASTDAAKVTPKASINTAKVALKVSTEAGKVTPKASTDAAKVTPKASTEAAKVTPKASTDSTKVTPKASTDAAKVTPKASTDAAKVTPKASTDAVKVTSKASTDSTKVTPKASTDAAKVTPKASTDAPKVTPKASTDSTKVTPKASINTAKVALKVSTEAGKVTPKASTDAAKVTPKASTDTAKVTPKASTDTAKITPKASTDAAKVTPKASTEATEMTQKFSNVPATVALKSSNVEAKITPKSSTDAARLIPKASKSSTGSVNVKSRSSTNATQITPKASTGTQKVRHKSSTDAVKKVTPKASTDAAKVASKSSTATNKVTPKVSTVAAKVRAKVSTDAVDVTSKPSTDAAKVTPKTSTDAVKVTPKASNDSAKVTSKTSTDAAKVTPKASTDAAKVTPKASTDAVKVTPKASIGAAKAIPKASTDAANSRTTAAKTKSISPKVSSESTQLKSKSSMDVSQNKSLNVSTVEVYSMSESAIETVKGDRQSNELIKSSKSVSKDNARVISSVEKTSKTSLKSSINIMVSNKGPKHNSEMSSTTSVEKTKSQSKRSLEATKVSPELSFETTKDSKQNLLKVSLSRGKAESPKPSSSDIVNTFQSDERASFSSEDRRPSRRPSHSSQTFGEQARRDTLTITPIKPSSPKRSPNGSLTDVETPASAKVNSTRSDDKLIPSVLVQQPNTPPNEDNLIDSAMRERLVAELEEIKKSMETDTQQGDGPTSDEKTSGKSPSKHSMPTVGLEFSPNKPASKRFSTGSLRSRKSKGSVEKVDKTEGGSPKTVLSSTFEVKGKGLGSQPESRSIPSSPPFASPKSSSVMQQPRKMSSRSLATALSEGVIVTPLQPSPPDTPKPKRTTHRRSLLKMTSSDEKVKETQSETSLASLKLSNQEILPHKASTAWMKDSVLSNNSLTIQPSPPKSPPSRPKSSPSQSQQEKIDSVRMLEPTSSSEHGAFTEEEECMRDDGQTLH
ncbi:uncharacterized protein LOC116618397 [Nematostella vectensis]|uniref:uncharacterized protein LOC116618397 n=1 Tax=Nematostella vectensis TaxID=45351 RepID=UPI00207773DA|nr:uncharacterized protein LOC116618397 [Nematostella vectensis]